MRKAEDYRKHAQECRAMLGACDTEEHRQMVLNMAETWETLARRREEQIAQKKRMEELEAGARRAERNANS